MTRVGQMEIVQRASDLTVCGEAGTARETMEAIARLKPDLVMMDLTLPDKDGLEVIKDIRALHPGLPVLVVSMHEETFYAPRVLRAGARGYVMKSEGPEKVIVAAQTVLGGQLALSPLMAAHLLESFTGLAGKGATMPETKLSDRELEVMRLFGEGWSAEEIARKLHLSTKTVDVHRGNIKEKFGFQTTPEFLRFAIGWVAARERADRSSSPGATSKKG